MRLRLSEWEKSMIRAEAKENNVSYKGLVEVLTEQNNNNFEQDLHDIVYDEDNLVAIRADYGEYEGEYISGE